MQNPGVNIGAGHNDYNNYITNIVILHLNSVIIRHIKKQRYFE